MITIANHLNKIYSPGGWAATIRDGLPSTARYCSIVVSEAVFNEGTDKEYAGNGFVLYGAAAATSRQTKSLCGREFYITNLYWDIEYDDLDDIEDAGLVAFIDRRGAIKVWKDRTLTSSATDPGRFLSNLVIIQDLTDDIRSGLRKYLGNPFPKPSIIENIVRQAIDRNEGFSSASYQITIYRRLGYFTIDLQVEFFGFVHTLNVKVDLRVA